MAKQERRREGVYGLTEFTAMSMKSIERDPIFREIVLAQQALSEARGRMLESGNGTRLSDVSEYLRIAIAHARAALDLCRSARNRGR